MHELYFFTLIYINKFHLFYFFNSRLPVLNARQFARNQNVTGNATSRNVLNRNVNWFVKIRIASLKWNAVHVEELLLVLPQDYPFLRRPKTIHNAVLVEINKFNFFWTETQINWILILDWKIEKKGIKKLEGIYLGAQNLFTGWKIKKRGDGRERILDIFCWRILLVPI